ncbi:MAG: acyl-CoA synthetase FdrA [Anaerolineae bacterium]|nr:acyl-CoA synthetase FdrA [Anaerolineae bacterium]MBL8105068.1 acyl-CoA synthetase FdrA [Anaerolineales bacterium]
MTVVKWNVRAGAYYDSVVLMQLQRGLLELNGVLDAGVVMATQANRDLLATNNLLPADISANPDDLLIVVKANDDTSAENAIGQVDELLARRKSSNSQDSLDFRPRSLSAAVKQLPEANWVLISVPGRYAAGVAREALELGKHVFLYSDNVSLEDEISLKKTAREKGLLVMGPDCGTAIINGIGLGFANRVRRGSIGVVGASGTGTQAVTAQIHNLGAGISHAIGTGGRDLKSDVGAITAHQALDVLARDPDTKVIALISKPPSPDVATQLISAAQSTGKPVVVYFIGYPAPARKIGNLHFAVSLSEAAEISIGELENQRILQSSNSRFLRGLYSGGTLAYETMVGLQASLSPLYSNSPITNSQNLDDPLHSHAHTIIDLGDEFFMVGRLHPMIDNDLRIRRMKQEAADAEVGMILFDVVLGEGSHLDPAGELAPVIKEIREKRIGELEFVAIVIGTDEDPQNLQSQISQLEDAGVKVFRTASEAVEYISLKFSHREANQFPPVNLAQLKQPLAGINVGLESFYESLISQGAQAVHVEWKPPAGGNERLASLLAKMKK